MSNVFETWILSQEDFFKGLPPVPDHLRTDFEQLVYWNNEFRLINVEAMKARLRSQRIEKQAAKTRADAISERQCLEVEREMERKKLQKWLQELERIKHKIDRITSKIITEMRERQRHMDADHARKAAEDLRIWESFKEKILQPPQLTRKQIEEMENFKQQQAQEAEEQRLREEIKALRERPAPSEDENRAAWEQFLKGME